MICGKRSFKTQREAHDFMKVLRDNAKSGKIPSRSYWCKYCQAYHLATEGKHRYRKLRQPIEKEEEEPIVRTSGETLITPLLKFNVK